MTLEKHYDRLISIGRDIVQRYNDVSVMRLAERPYFIDFGGLLNVNELTHHGIKGMKRGVRNGPPYSLDSDVKKEVEKNSHRGIIKSIDVDDFELITYNKDVEQDVRDVIIDTMKRCENDNGFVISEVSDGIKSTSEHGVSVLQIEPLANGLLKLNVNLDFLSGKTLEEIDSAFENSKNTVVNSLEDAVIHESGHAVSIKGKSVYEIDKLYEELSQIHKEGISKIAYDDGAECLAELEVLRSRGTSVSEDNASFYKKYMGREY